MPHLTLEYTANVTQKVDFHRLFPALHQILADVAGIELDNCKSRSLRLDTYHVGHGEEHDGFVHLTIRILDGRPAEVRRAISRQCLGLLEKTYGPSLGEMGLQITVDVAEMQRATYAKIARASTKSDERRHDVRVR